MQPNAYMNRRTILKWMLVVPLGSALLAACARALDEPAAVSSSGEEGAGKGPPKTRQVAQQVAMEGPAAWKSRWRNGGRCCRADAYGVLFEESTEPPFFSPLNDEHRAGTLCLCGVRVAAVFVGDEV